MSSAAYRGLTGGNSVPNIQPSPKGEIPDLIIKLGQSLARGAGMLAEFSEKITPILTDCKPPTAVADSPSPVVDSPFGRALQRLLRDSESHNQLLSDLLHNVRL